MLKKVLPFVAVVAGAVFMAAPVRADNVFFDYADISLSFDDATGKLTVTDHAATSLKATHRNDLDVVIDRADIASAASFNVLLDATVANVGVPDGITMTGTLEGTDTATGSPPAYKANFANSAFGSDLDGVTFFGGTLTIRGHLTGIGGSILIDPAGPGPWIFTGTSDAPDGPGADATANQFTISGADRDNYTTGTVFVIDITVAAFLDGFSTGGIANADDFFAAALAHDGFSTTGGDMKVTIIPAPGAALLAMLGMGMVGWIKRRV